MVAASGAAPGGFSYAQAARSRPTPSTSAAPASNQSSKPIESLEPSKDWADEVNAVEKEQAAELSQRDVKEGKSAVERTKSESRPQSHPSGVSSPDIAASATSNDDASTQNGSSQTSWEAKTQTSESATPSEPAWIAERKERQSTHKQEPNGETETTPKPPVLHDAPPPAVNPWAKRAEDQKAKQPAVAKPETQHENQKPTARHNSAPVNAARPPHQKSSNPAFASDKSQPRSVRSEAQKPAFNASVVKDNVSWPTPENSQDAERKSSTDPKPQEESAEDGQAGKPRKKADWKAMPVVPNIIWQTPGVRDRAPRSAPNGDRPARGGSSARGRGGARGNANVGDRSTAGKGDVAEASQSDRASVRASSVSSRRGEDRADSAPNDTHGTSDAAPKEDPAQSAEVKIAEPETAEVVQRHASAPINGTITNGVLPHEAQAPSESRRDSKEQAWTPSTRGSRRGRGRGGNRDIVNGHGFQNGLNGEPPHFHPYEGAQPRGNASYGFSRRGGGTPQHRANSLPFDGYYGRMSPYMQQPPQFPMSAVQPGFPQFYDYAGAPVPYSPMQEQTNLSAIGYQIEYYFSVDNLLKDMFLRKNMDSQGFVLLDTIAAFKKVAELTQDREALKAACRFSKTVEIRVGDDGRERLRALHEPERWVMPLADRVESARNDGPASVSVIEHAPGALDFRPQQPMLPPQHFQEMDQRDLRRFSQFMPPPPPMYPPEFAHMQYPGAFMNGDGYRDQQVKSPRDFTGPEVQSPIGQNGHDEPDEDVFSNDHIQQLTVCVKLSKDNSPPYLSTTRTFSHGSIDADVINAEQPPKEKPLFRRETSPAADAKTDEQKAGEQNTQDLSVFWIKDNDKPVSLLPSNLTPEPYLSLRHKALEQRSHAAAGTCPYDLDVLYQFWSHFLIRNFNNNMYSDFKQFATQDAAERDNTVGQRNLAKYYDQALNSANVIPLRVAKDYVKLAKAEIAASATERPVFKTLHRSWRDGALNLRNRKRLSDLLDGELKQLLEG